MTKSKYSFQTILPLLLCAASFFCFWGGKNLEAIGWLLLADLHIISGKLHDLYLLAIDSVNKTS